MTTTQPEYTVKARPVTGWFDDEPLEFTVSQSNYVGDWAAPWYTVIAKPAAVKGGYRFLVYRGSQYVASSIRGKAQLGACESRTAVIEAVKAHLAAQ